MADAASDPLLTALEKLDNAGAEGAPAGAVSRPPLGDHRHDPASDLAAMMATAGAAPPTPPPAQPTSADAIGARGLRVLELDRAVRAFVWLDIDRARREAADAPPRSALAGTTIAHKDILLTAGQPTSAGSELLAGFVADRDAEVVQRLRAAGAISLGKVATHEFASGVTGTVTASAVPVNPRSPGHIPGGSSSGSAAAVAAGLVDAASGTDTGGSLRIPAACCGVVGFKPSSGLVSTRGVIPFSWSLDHVGPLAASVDLARRLVAAMAGADLPADEGRAPRVSVARELLEACDPAVAEVVREAAAGLVARGARLREVRLPDLWHRAPAVAAAIFLAEGAAFHAPGLARHPERYRPPTRALLERATAVSGVRYVQAQRLRRRFTEAMEELLAETDALLLPAIPCPPPRLGDETVALPGGTVDVRAALTRFTRQSNLSGQPAVVVPFARVDGLPVGVQLVGGRGQDARLLAVAELLEGAAGGPWAPELPPAA